MKHLSKKKKKKLWSKGALTWATSPCRTWTCHWYNCMHVSHMHPDFFNCDGPYMSQTVRNDHHMASTHLFKILRTTKEKWEICIHLEKSPLLIEGFTVLLMRVSFYSLQALLLSLLPLPPIDWWWMSCIATHVSPSQLVFWISLSLSLFSLHYSDFFFLDFFFSFLKLKYWKLLEVWN